MITDNWRSRYSDQASIVVSPEFALLVKVHGEIAKATFHFFESKGFCYVPVPGTTGSSSSPTEPGSDSAPVIIEIEGKRNMLTDSAQFHLEYACRSYQEGCFYYGHSYRNEDPDERHLAQFTHAEAEMAGTLEDVKMLVEDYIRYLTESIWENLADCLFKIPGIQDRIDNLLKSKYHFQSISFDDAYKFFKKNEGLFKYCDNGGYRLTAEGERNLLDNFGEFIWIEKWDKMAVPFYQATDDKTGIALNADLLFGMGEVVGAGQRHADASKLVNALNDHGLNLNDYNWYINMKEQYFLQTSGFGMGIERYMMWLLGIKDIRALELFPRNRLQIGEV